MSSSRTFITHSDGTGEIYNLEVVREHELPEFFRQHMFEYDDSWKDAAQRWLFFNASHLSDERAQEIVETHNEECERILERGHFNGYNQIVHPYRGQESSKEYAIYNLEHRCFLGELGGFTEEQTFCGKREIAEFLLEQVHNYGHLKESDLKHLQVVSISTESEVTEKVREAAKEYRQRLDEDKPNEVTAEEAIANSFDEIKQDTEVVE